MIDSFWGWPGEPAIDRAERSVWPPHSHKSADVSWVIMQSIPLFTAICVNETGDHFSSRLLLHTLMYQPQSSSMGSCSRGRVLLSVADKCCSHCMTSHFSLPPPTSEDFTSLFISLLLLFWLSSSIYKIGGQPFLYLESSVLDLQVSSCYCLSWPRSGWRVSQLYRL